MKTSFDEFTFARFAFLTISIFLAHIDGLSASEPRRITRLNMAQVPVVFGEAPESGKPTVEFHPGEETLTKKEAGVKTTLFGKLGDTGAINLFYAYWYDGRHTAHRRYYVKDRIYTRPHTSVWATVDATITHVDTRDDDKHEIQIHSYRCLSAKEMQAIARASVNSHQWLSDNRQMIDLNEFKKGRSQPYLIDEANWKSDFNKLHRRDNVEIRSLDMTRGVAELICSRNVIEELPSHHAVYIDLVMVYDLKNGVPIRLLVQRSGYFLE